MPEPEKITFCVAAEAVPREAMHLRRELAEGDDHAKR